MGPANRVHSYVYLNPACINLDGRQLALDNGEISLSAEALTMLHAVLGGLGRVDMLARAACQKDGSRQKWSREFLREIEKSAILGVEKLPESVWPKQAVLICDWNGTLSGLANSQGPTLHWQRPSARGRKRVFQLGSKPNLFMQAQLMRSLLGAHRRSRVILASGTDRALFGDLLHRHNSLVCVAKTWPESRRVWQVHGRVLQEDPNALEELYYALRHVNDDQAGDLSAVAGTVFAGQEVRALCDASMVLCWTEAQESELVMFYGRSKNRVKRITNEVDIRGMIEVKARRAMARAVMSWLNVVGGTA